MRMRAESGGATRATTRRSLPSVGGPDPRLEGCVGSDARGTDLRARLAGVACLARATAYTSPAHAFRTLADDPGRGLSAPATWATATETWYLHVGTLPAAEAGLLEVAARDAFRTWEAEPCTTLRGNYRGLSGPPMTGDGRNTIGLMESGWVESGLPASSAATTGSCSDAPTMARRQSSSSTATSTGRATSSASMWVPPNNSISAEFWSMRSLMHGASRTPVVMSSAQSRPSPVAEGRR